jgi:hypothetical protein
VLPEKINDGMYEIRRAIRTAMRDTKEAFGGVRHEAEAQDAIGGWRRCLKTAAR